MSDKLSRLNDVLTAGEFEGVKFTVLDRPIKIGDTYLASGNLEMKLLTVKDINHAHGFVVPVENGYAFNTNRCIPIELHFD